VYPAAVGAAAQPPFELGDRDVQGAVEVASAGFGPDHGPTREAGDLDALAVVGLTRVAFVE
jgi:hypothetical protein